MFNPSSIFNFNTLQSIPKPTRSFFLCLIILLSVGTSISSNRSLFEKTLPKYPTITPVLSYIDTHYADKPEVIFMGSSRLVSCIKTYPLAKLLNISPECVLNLSIDSGSFWEYQVIYRENSNFFNKCKVAIINVEPWMFNKNIINPIFKTQNFYQPYFTIWATLSERLAHPDFISKISMAFDFFWPVSEKRSLDSWISLIQSSEKGKNNFGHLGFPDYHSNQQAYHALANSPIFKANSIARDHMNNYRFSNIKARYLEDLINNLKSKCDHIILLQPPVRKEYMNVIYNNKSYHETYQHVVSFLHDLEKKKDNIQYISWETPEMCGLNESIFVDYGHFNKNGAYQFTDLLFNTLVDDDVFESINSGEKCLPFPANVKIAELQQLLKYFPDNWSYRSQLGLLYAENDQTEEAEKELQTAIEINPGSSKILRTLSSIYIENGKFNQAIETLQQMADIEPDNENIYYNISCLYSKLNKKQKAIKWLKIALNKGYKNYQHLKLDKDMENIKDTDFFKKLTSEVR